MQDYIVDISAIQKLREALRVISEAGQIFNQIKSKRVS